MYSSAGGLWSRDAIPSCWSKRACTTPCGGSKWASERSQELDSTLSDPVFRGLLAGRVVPRVTVTGPHDLNHRPSSPATAEAEGHSTKDYAPGLHRHSHQAGSAADSSFGGCAPVQWRIADRHGAGPPANLGADANSDGPGSEECFPRCLILGQLLHGMKRSTWHRV